MKLKNLLQKLKNKCFACLGFYNRIPGEQLDPNPLNDIDKDQDLAALQILHEDLRLSHSETLNGFNDLSNKNTRLLQFTGTVFAVVAAAATVVGEIAQFINGLTILGVTSLILSILLLIYLSKTTSVKAGVGRDVMNVVIGSGVENSPLNEMSYRLWICKKYTDWIDIASKRNRTNACRLRIAEMLTIAGLALLFAGILIETP